MPRRERKRTATTQPISATILPHTMIEMLRANPIADVLYAIGHPVAAYEKGWSFQFWSCTVMPGATAFTYRPDEFKPPMHVFCMPLPNTPEERVHQQARTAAVEGTVYMLLKGQYKEAE